MIECRACLCPSIDAVSGDQHNVIQTVTVEVHDLQRQHRCCLRNPMQQNTCPQNVPMLLNCLVLILQPKARFCNLTKTASIIY